MRPQGQEVSMHLNQVCDSIDQARHRRDWLIVGDTIPNTTLVVTGFGKKYVPREGLHYRQAGVYIDFCLVNVVNIATGVYGEGLRITEEKVADTPLEALCSPMSEIMIRIGDLPTTCIMPGDTVRFPGERRLFVRKLDYEQMGTTHKYPLFYCDIEQPDGRWFHCQEAFGNQEQLEVLDRGNLFKFSHGKEMNFSSIEEEARFYQELGFSHKATFPNGIDTCLIGDAITMLADGKASDIKIVDKKTLLCAVIVYDVPGNFPVRMREHALKRLGIST
jgi:hypothetical protein